MHPFLAEGDMEYRMTVFKYGLGAAVLAAGTVFVIRSHFAPIEIDFDDTMCRLPLPQCRMAPRELQAVYAVYGKRMLKISDLVFFQFNLQEKGGSISCGDAIRALDEDYRHGLRTLRVFPDKMAAELVNCRLLIPRKYIGKCLICPGRTWRSEQDGKDYVAGVVQEGFWKTPREVPVALDNMLGANHFILGLYDGWMVNHVTRPASAAA